MLPFLIKVVFSNLSNNESFKFKHHNRPVTVSSLKRYMPLIVVQGISTLTVYGDAKKVRNIEECFTIKWLSCDRKVLFNICSKIFLTDWVNKMKYASCCWNLGLSQINEINWRLYQGSKAFILMIAKKSFLRSKIQLLIDF